MIRTFRAGVPAREKACKSEQYARIHRRAMAADPGQFDQYAHHARVHLRTRCRQVHAHTCARP